MIRPGEVWGERELGPPDIEVRGGDANLAAAAAAHPGALVRFVPGLKSDFARAVGLSAGAEPNGLAVPIDALQIEPADALPQSYAVNAVVLGVPPGRSRSGPPKAQVRVRVDGRTVADGPATTVVIASGQFIDGLDVVPRGHPGDGRIEVQVYALRRGEWRKMQTRLPQGAHLPNPRIATATGRRVEVELDGARLPVRVDGILGGPVAGLSVRVVPGAVRLLV